MSFIVIHCHDTHNEAITVTRQQWQEELHRDRSRKDNKHTAKLQPAQLCISINGSWRIDVSTNHRFNTIAASYPRVGVKFQPQLSKACISMNVMSSLIDTCISVTMIIISRHFSTTTSHQQPATYDRQCNHSTTYPLRCYWHSTNMVPTKNQRCYL